VIGHDPGQRAKWQVLWVKDRQVYHKDFNTDLMEAMRVYHLLKEAGRKGVTLRCKNFGFPPPAKYLPHEKKMKRRLDPPRIIKRGRKRYRQNYEVVTVIINPMKERNKQGIWWCPYCQQFRRFVKQYEMKVDHVRVPDVALVCPMCRTPHRDMNVRKWNPIATQVYYELETAPQRAPARNRKANYEKKKRRKKRERRTKRS
jgi:hypothetical protein